MWWWSVLALAGTPPTVGLEWKKASSSLKIGAPEGFELAEDAIADLTLSMGGQQLHAELPQAVVASGLSLGEVRGTDLSGDLRVVLCDKASGSCQPTDWRLSGALPQNKRGSVALSVAPAQPEPGPAAPHPATFGPHATTDAVQAAFAQAKAEDGFVLLDFSAVWCPPCMVLAAEVLHADPAPKALQGYQVAVIDVDHVSSFAHKDRYDIGSYPTVVVVDAMGNERSRMVGYPGREAFLRWLSTATEDPTTADLASDPAEIEPDRAAQLAWILAQAHEFESAGPWIERAEAGGSEIIELSLAQQQLEPTAERLAWLIEHAPRRAYEWAFSALELAEDHRELAQKAAALAVAHTEGQELADALYLAGRVEEDEAQARLLYAAAASTVASDLGDHPARDKAYLTWLADLHELAGNVDAAIELLEMSSSDYPDEPTFDLSLAHLLLRAERPEQALIAADRAVQRAWGDNLLRAAAAKAKILAALDRREEAAVVAAEALAAVEAEEGLDVRTHKYRERLSAWLETD
ncbi:MAG TPA: hypothetical protein ENK18_18535 [Deltaproteobacteria bacterium]|nr:hypothetical protein [Deltaproteobacteria bacterium]